MTEKQIQSAVMDHDQDDCHLYDIAEIIVINWLGKFQNEVAMSIPAVVDLVDAIHEALHGEITVETEDTLQ